MLHVIQDLSSVTCHVIQDPFFFVISVVTSSTVTVTVFPMPGIRISYRDQGVDNQRDQGIDNHCQKGRETRV
jgi:hypothetical protein